MTTEERVLGLFSKRVAYGAPAAASSSTLTSLPGLASLTDREKTQQDTVPGDTVWSGVVMEPAGQCYVCWDKGHLVRGVVGLEVTRLQARLEVVQGVRAAVWEALREVGSPPRHDPGMPQAQEGATSMGADLRSSALADVGRLPVSPGATAWTAEAGGWVGWGVGGGGHARPVPSLRDRAHGNPRGSGGVLPLTAFSCAHPCRDVVAGGAAQGVCPHLGQGQRHCNHVDRVDSRRSGCVGQCGGAGELIYMCACAVCSLAYRA